VHRLGDDEVEIVSEPVVEPAALVPNLVGVAEYRLHPDLAVGADLDGTSRQIVGPEIECAATCQFKACVTPVAG